jgi:hypothetical protein
LRAVGSHGLHLADNPGRAYWYPADVGAAGLSVCGENGPQACVSGMEIGPQAQVAGRVWNWTGRRPVGSPAAKQRSWVRRTEWLR